MLNVNKTLKYVSIQFGLFLHRKKENGSQSYKCQNKAIQQLPLTLTGVFKLPVNSVNTMCTPNYSRHKNTENCQRSVQHSDTAEQGCRNYPIIEELPQNSRHQKGDMKQHPNISGHCTKFSRHSDLTHWICAGLLSKLKLNGFR